VLFACAEALYAHGYSNEACRLAVELARDLLANPPDLKVEQPQTKVERRRDAPSRLFNLLSFSVSPDIPSLRSPRLPGRVRRARCPPAARRRSPPTRCPRPPSCSRCSASGWSSTTWPSASACSPWSSRGLRRPRKLWRSVPLPKIHTHTLTLRPVTP